MFWGAELVLEKEAEIDALGVKVGLRHMSGPEYHEYLSGSNWRSSADVTGETFSLPLTVFYKYKVTPFFHVIGGLGVTATNVDWKVDKEQIVYYGWSATQYTLSEQDGTLKIYPHLNVGVEWMLGRHLGLGIDLVYNINAKTNKAHLDGVNQTLQLDLSGLQGGAMLRWYF